MQLIGYPKAGTPWSVPGVDTYSLIQQGLRIGLGAPQGLAGSDITGHQGGARGTGRGRVAVAFGSMLGDGQQTVVDFKPQYHTSTGTGSATLYRTKVLKRGPRKGQRVRVGVIAKRGAIRGQAMGKQARGTGSGVDADSARAQALESWLCPLQSNTDKPDTTLAAQRQRILAEIASESDLSGRLQAIGARAARRQARRLVELRGVKPSDTSVQDAAQDAIVGILQHVRRVDKATAAHWQSMRFVRVIALYAGRAAFNSLCSWSRLGVTGDNTGAGTASNWCEFVTDALDTIHQEHHHQGEPVDARARRAVVRWVFNIGLRQFAAGLPVDMRGAARASAVNAARRRCRVVGSIIFGASLADACIQAGGTLRFNPVTGEKIFIPGFTSANNFQDSCRTAGFWTALKAARVASIRDIDHPASVDSVAIARSNQTKHAERAKQTARALQSMAGREPWRDVFTTDTLRATSARGMRSTARRLHREALLATLRDSVQWAQYFKALADKLTRDNLRAFDRVSDKLKSGAFQDLHAVTVGKHHKGAQSALIGRARGKVSKAKVLAPTVAVKVQTKFGERKLHCAQSQGVQPWCTDSFTVCNP